VRVKELKNLIEQNLPDSAASVRSEDEIHFSAEVICPAFKGKSRVQQQQMVYQIVDSYIKSGEIHALSLKTQAN
jgi:acid stress-induced BolA-like protein IbaG/YrbA